MAYLAFGQFNTGRANDPIKLAVLIRAAGDTGRGLGFVCTFSNSHHQGHGF